MNMRHCWTGWLLTLVYGRMSGPDNLYNAFIENEEESEYHPQYP